jgi:putative membrane protein
VAQEPEPSSPHGPKPKGFLQLLEIFISGLCVGSAEVFPGISGGTVAFIIGIYEDLLKSISSINVKAIKSLFQAQFATFFNLISWQFLIVFLLGDMIALVTMAKLFTKLINDEFWRVYVYAGFVGLVVGSCIYCFKILHHIRFKDVISFSLGCLAAFMLSGTRPPQDHNELKYNVPVDEKMLPETVLKDLHSKQCINYSYKTHELLDVPAPVVHILMAKKILKEDQDIWDVQNNSYVKACTIQAHSHRGIDLWVVLCGSIAIVGMLLPGISGSYLLNVLGMYGIILGALVDWVTGLQNMTFDWGSFRIVFSMGLGITIGAVLFARVVSWLLEHYHQLTISCLIGFMVGALRAVWPFWTYQYELDPLHIMEGPRVILDSPILPHIFSSHFLLALLAAICGVIVVLTIEALAAKKRARS